MAQRSRQFGMNVSSLESDTSAFQDFIPNINLEIALVIDQAQERRNIA